jgi:transcriptional regulator with XRE-family HTH domain
MRNDLGTFLRDLRTSRQMSLTRLAARAGIGKSTLSRWESGRFQPRLSELEAVISALDVGPDERERALALVDAPRAVAQLRRESDARRGAVSGDGWHVSQAVGHAPCTGDLLRALRLRRRLPLDVVAARLGVQARTVRRWEASQSVVPGERLEALCALLGVQPEERAALTNHLLLGAVGPTRAERDAARAREACASEVAALAAGTERGEHRLMDLRFLLLEARLYPLATTDPPARRLLAE